MNYYLLNGNVYVYNSIQEAQILDNIDLSSATIITQAQAQAIFDADHAAGQASRAAEAADRQSLADKLRVSSDVTDEELATIGLPTSTAVYVPPSGFPAGTLAQRQSIADKFAENKKFSLTDNELAALGLPSSDEN